MINPNELRIGNLVLHKDFIIVIDGIDRSNECVMIEDKHIEIPLADINPIPLSPEWLERCGFDKCKSDDDEERDIWSIQVSNNTSLYYDRDEKFKNWYLSHEWNNNHFQNDFWACPEYLHQLQNLYHSLTGEELTIKEKV